MSQKSKDKRPENAETPPPNTGYPQPASSDYPQTGSSGYPQTASPGYPQTASPGYPQTASPGYPQTASPGYPQTASSSYRQTANVGVYPVNTGCGLPTAYQLGTLPTSVVCPSCNQQIVTRVAVRPSMKTHLVAILICIVFWPCVFLPYCIPYCQNSEHYCPHCGAYIGTHIN